MRALIEAAGGYYSYWDTGRDTPLRELLMNEGLAVHVSQMISPGHAAWEYFGFGRRQYARVRERELRIAFERALVEIWCDVLGIEDVDDVGDAERDHPGDLLEDVDQVGPGTDDAVRVGRFGGRRARAFRLGCTPIINLFARMADPIYLSQQKYEYQVLPDVHRQATTEIYSVDEVITTEQDYPRMLTTFQQRERREGIVLKGIQALSDFAGGMSLDPAEIDKERGVVKEEWRLRRGA